MKVAHALGPFSVQLDFVHIRTKSAILTVLCKYQKFQNLKQPLLIRLLPGYNNRALHNMLPIAPKQLPKYCF